MVLKKTEQIFVEIKINYPFILYVEDILLCLSILMTNEENQTSPSLSLQKF